MPIPCLSSGDADTSRGEIHRLNRGIKRSKTGSKNSASKDTPKSG